MLATTQKRIFIWLALLSSLQLSWAAVSLNNYGDAAYPGRCVLDAGDQFVLLNSQESWVPQNLPCTFIFCMSEGWGMLFTCDYPNPPDDCHYTDFIALTKPYPRCCKRRIFC